jgi:excisionase family DNA binding protein
MAAHSRVLWPILLSVSELADAMGVDRRYVRKMIANGMPVQRLGVKRRIIVADAVEAIRKNFQIDGSPK